MVADFGDLTQRRVEKDSRLESWANGVSEAWLQDDLTWLSGISNREMTKPRTLLVMHLFNHQTHHRGQAHAMLTAAGKATGDTDLPWIVYALPQKFAFERLGSAGHENNGLVA